MRQYKVQDKMLTKKEWLKKVSHDLENQLQYTDELWQSDNYGTGKGYYVYYTLAIEKE